MIFVAFVMMIPGTVVLLKDNLRLTRRNTLTGWRRITVALFLLIPLPLILLASVITAQIIIRTQVDPLQATRVTTIFGGAAIVSGWLGALTFALLVNPED